jgi:hypothetical protein
MFSKGGVDHDAVRISTHIQEVMRGKRIICAPPETSATIGGYWR